MNCLMLWKKSIQGIFGVAIFNFSRLGRLRKNRKYTILLGKYASKLNKSSLGEIIFELGLYSRFLKDSQWRGTIFYAIGLLYYDDYLIFRSFFRSLLQRRKRLSYLEKELILRALLSTYPCKARAFCKLYFPKDILLYFSLLSFLDKKTVVQSERLFTIKRPQNILLAANFIASQPEQQIGFINEVMGFYQLPKISLVDRRLPLFVTNIKSGQESIVKTDDHLPLVSVLMTTFNSQEFVEASLLSLIKQNYSNKEIIVVDDNSSDDTCKIIHSLSVKYPFIRLIQLPVNVGTYVAKSIAIKFARGEFVTCHDSDDWAHPNKLIEQMQPLLNDPNLVATFSKWFRVSKEGKAYSRMIIPFIRLNPSSALFRRKIVESQIGLWDWVKTGADSEFNARIKLVFGERLVKVVNKPLTIGSHRENSLMTSLETEFSSGKRIIRQQYWESWNEWHIKQISRNKHIRINNRVIEDSFPVPSEIRVNKRNVYYCFNQLGLSMG
ncbi:glycosyltransferase family 2 protein [Avibacterium paragallinarum]|uniref:glycosyltransferase family 2 protein n=2 Tax=Avibacterium paragallinarum TaxID=728 RepID=UPI001CFAEF28|nr:glycosyltransferase family 2 protein [Avibacterium paragallinarum]WAM60301.1 glycosyltransferase family 2 protein [Avibacterium paragallinarum]